MTPKSIITDTELKDDNTIKEFEKKLEILKKYPPQKVSLSNTQSRELKSSLLETYDVLYKKSLFQTSLFRFYIPSILALSFVISIQVFFIQPYIVSPDTSTKDTFITNTLPEKDLSEAISEDWVGTNWIEKDTTHSSQNNVFYWWKGQSGNMFASDNILSVAWADVPPYSRIIRVIIHIGIFISILWIGFFIYRKYKAKQKIQKNQEKK